MPRRNTTLSRRDSKYCKRTSPVIPSAFYCPDAASALEKALELISEGASVGWGGALSAQQIGLIDAVKNGNYAAIDRDAAKTPEERNALLKRCLTADVFLSGANALSLDEKAIQAELER